MEIKHREINSLCFEFLCFFNQRKKYVKLRRTHNARDVNSPMIGPLKSEKNKTSYSHRTCCKAKSLKVFFCEMFYSSEHGSFINFPCCICCCHSHGFAFFLSSSPFAVKIYNSFCSAPFHFMFADFFLPRSMLNILKYIFTARDMRKKFPKTKNTTKVSNASHRAIITQAKLMELFISLSAYTILFTLRNWKLKRRRENECFMKIRRWSQGHFALRPNENAICCPMKNLCRSNWNNKIE